MKYTYYSIVAGLTCTILLACTNPNGTTQNTQTDTTSIHSKPETDIDMDSSTMMSDGHNAQNALDWSGNYVGTLPCADCEGIKTTIELRSDNTYLLKEEYLGKDAVFEAEGQFTWNNNGNTITLSDKDSKRNFQVQEGALLHLDQEGKIIEGAMADIYMLRKL